MSYLIKLKPRKNQKCTKRSFRLLNKQSYLRSRHYYPQRPGLHGNQTRSTILSRGTEAECSNYSATKIYLYLKQREIRGSLFNYEPFEHKNQSKENFQKQKLFLDSTCIFLFFNIDTMFVKKNMYPALISKFL